MMPPMPRVPPFDREATYADLERLPDTFVAELAEGWLYASPRPAPRHATASSQLGVVVGRQLSLGRRTPGGWRILDEPELHLGRDVLVPDLAGWRRERMPRLPETAYFALAPDWVCEVVSPPTAEFDRQTKLRIYARERIGHAWLIDPVARTLEVWRLETGAWVNAGTFAGDATVCAEPFGEVAVDLAELWDEP
jgi:Uma2 family endonuclease